MVAWLDFATEAPKVAEIFVRRHAATGNLCLLATLRADGYPRISPLEPRIFEGELVLVGMPDTLKFRDLDRDARFALHTATVDTHVGDGDAKLWGDAHHVPDVALHRRFADDLFAQTGFDLRGQGFDRFYVADLKGASSLELVDDQLEIRIWKAGEGERVVRKT